MGRRSAETRDWLMATAAVAVMIGLGALRMAPGVTGLYHDDGVYVATAKALAQGDGYRLINLPDQPLQTKYPFLYPTLLAGLWMLWPSFPDNLLLLQSFSLACSSLSVGLGYLYIVRFGHATRREALSATLVCATSPAALFFATQTLAEPLFSLSIILALWVADDAAHRKTPSAIAAWCRGGIIGTCLLIRVVAAPIVAATMTIPFWRTGRPLALVVGVLSVSAPWVAWLAWASFNQTHATAGYDSFEPYISWWVNDPATVTRTVLLNLLKLCHATLAIPVSALSAVLLTWPVILIGGLGWFMLMGRVGTRHLPESAMLAYSAVVLFWPWPPSRFVVPVAVLTTALILAALRPIRRHVPTKPRRWLSGLAVLVAIGFNVSIVFRETAMTRRTGFPQLETSKAVSWNDYQLVFRWIRDHTQSNDIVASGLDSMVWAYTERPTIRPFEPSPAVMFYEKHGEALGSVDALANTLIDRSVRFFVRLPMPGFAIEPHLDVLLERLIRERPHCLNERLRSPTDARFVIYEVAPGSCAGPIKETGRQ